MLSDREGRVIFISFRINKRSRDLERHQILFVLFALYWPICKLIIIFVSFILLYRMLDKICRFAHGFLRAQWLK